MKWIVIVILAVAASVWGYKNFNRAKAADEAATVEQRPKFAPAETRDIRFSVNAAGEIGPAEQVSVKPEINGRIETLPVDIGDEVKKDQVLFTLDDKELQNERSSIVTEIERAKLQLAQQERNYKRAQELHKEKLIAQELFENAKTEFDLAKNALERTERSLAIVEEKLSKTQISAPFDCTILTRPVSIGQAVSGSGGFNSGTEVLTIADLNAMVINAHINQADITRLKQNMEVSVSVEAVPGLMITGLVERIAPQATIKNNIKGFAARILLKDPDRRIRPGMTANIRIPVASADDVLAVPLAAVFTERNPETFKTERYVLVQTGTTVERRPVQVGVADFFYAEIQKGLEPGEIVALEQPKEEQERLAQSKLAGNSDTKAGGATKASGGAKNAATPKT
ncbi:MAG: efflux RND transporter periplasmic adaptor subunit [Verrucomicrobiales bacterium]